MKSTQKNMTLMALHSPNVTVLKVTIKEPKANKLGCLSKGKFIGALNSFGARRLKL